MSYQEKSSVDSIISRMSYAAEEEPNYEDMSNEELVEYLRVSKKNYKILRLENDVFEYYLAQNDPKSLVEMEQALEATKLVTARPISSIAHNMKSIKMVGKSTSLSPRSATSFGTFSGSQRFHDSVMNYPISKRIRFSITLTHRISMVDKFIDEMKKDLLNRKKEAMKKQITQRAQLEEIQLRIKYINDSRKEFEENVKKGTDPLTGKISVEKVLHYIETWLKMTDRKIDELTLKSSNLKSQIMKLKNELKQREEFGETFHLIDFEALTIENGKLLKKIKHQNRQIVEVKKILGRYTVENNIYKNKLKEKEMILNENKKQIEKRINQISKLNIDLGEINYQLEKLKIKENKIVDNMKITSELNMKE